MFTIEQIFCFNAVYTTHSYSKAGNLLNKKRSTVREHIKVLEDTIGVALFDLEGKSLVPTFAARQLHVRAYYLAKHAKDLQEMALSLFDASLEQLVIYYDPALPTAFICDVETAISEKMPNLTVHWLSRQRTNAYEDLKSGRAHVALLASENLTATSSELISFNLGSLKSDAYASASHPLACVTSISINDLRFVKQYMTEHASIDGLGCFMVSNQHRIVSNMDTLLAMVKLDGWTILPEEVARPHVKQGELVKLQLDEMLKSQSQAVCAFVPITFTASEEIEIVLSLIKQCSVNYFS